jgi:DNA polymerase III delta prime subunit
MISSDLWVEKYRPQNLDDYVWSSIHQRNQVESWVAEGRIPHLCITGVQGTGKTSLCFMLLKLLGVHSSDVKFVNGCTDNGIDVVRDLENFVSTMAMGNFRYVMIDESDYFSPNGQAGLKNMMETYSGVARFIFTANLSHKIIPPIKSRCQTFEIQSLDRAQYFERIATILVKEGVDLNESNLAILDDYVDTAYPDLRKCINMLQQNCINGKLNKPSGDTVSGTSEYMVAAVSLFKQGRITEARKLLSSKIQINEYEEFYRLLYRNLDWWGNTDQKQNQAIVVIANRLRDHSIAADPEILMAATLVELELIRNG